MENSFSFTVFIKTRNLNSLLIWAHKVLFINKDDFQSVLHTLRTLMFINTGKRLTRWNANRCYSLKTTYLNFELSNSFYNSFIDFYSWEVVL